MSALFRPIVLWSDDPTLAQTLAQQLPHLRLKVLAANQISGPAEAYSPEAEALLVLDTRPLPGQPTNTRQLLYQLSQLSIRAPLIQAVETGTWQLHEPSRQLTAPNQHSVRLSTAEYQLLRCLYLAEQDHLVSRTTLLHQLGLLSGATHAADPSHHQTLNMRVRRLRLKAQQTGQALLIDTIPGEGYRLCTRLAVKQT